MKNFFDFIIILSLLLFLIPVIIVVEIFIACSYLYVCGCEFFDKLFYVPPPPKKIKRTKVEQGIVFKKDVS